MNLTEAVIYQPKQDIAGVRPYFVLPNQDSVDYFDSCGGAPEAQLIEWAAQFLDVNRTFVDIGSHIGTWGLTYGALGCYDVRCYEPQERLWRLCMAGAALNGFWNVDCLNTGIWSEISQRILSAPYADGGGGSVVVAHENVLLVEEVDLFPLDLFELEPGLIKIDVEGAELGVLKGARKTIRDNQPTILFECWQDERGQNTETLFRYLWDTLEYDTVQVNGWPEMWLAEPK